MKRLYLDNCCFNRPYDDQQQLKIKLETEAKLYIQQELLVGKYELTWSYILDYEIDISPFEAREEKFKQWNINGNDPETVMAKMSLVYSVGLTHGC